MYKRHNPDSKLLKSDGRIGCATCEYLTSDHSINLDLICGHPDTGEVRFDPIGGPYLEPHICTEVNKDGKCPFYIEHKRP